MVCGLFQKCPGSKIRPESLIEGACWRKRPADRNPAVSKSNNVLLGKIGDWAGDWELPSIKSIIIYSCCNSRGSFKPLWMFINQPMEIWDINGLQKLWLTKSGLENLLYRWCCQPTGDFLWFSCEPGWWLYIWRPFYQLFHGCIWRFL